MCAFYSNRFAKIVDGINQSIYLSKKLGLFDDIINGKEFTLKANDEEIKKILAQREFLITISDKIIREKQKKDEEFTNNIIGELIKSEKSSTTLDTALKKYKTYYNSYYNTFWLSKFDNDIVEDLETAFLGSVDKINLYDIKNSGLETALATFADEENNKKSKNVNWGYIDESSNIHNSIENGKDKILLGFDLKDFNMPVKLHCGIDLVQKAMGEYTPSQSDNPVIPVYQGNDDAIISDKFYTTQVLAKLTKRQKTDLRNTLKKMKHSDIRYKFLSHINWMCLPTRKPEHLAKQPHRIVDLYTGKYLDANLLNLSSTFHSNSGNR